MSKVKYNDKFNKSEFLTTRIKKSKNKLIEIFKNYREKSSSNFLANYFISIAESILQFNYSSITTIMNVINKIPKNTKPMIPKGEFSRLDKIEE